MRVGSAAMVKGCVECIHDSTVRRARPADPSMENCAGLPILAYDYHTESFAFLIERSRRFHREGIVAIKESGISWTGGTLNSLYGCTECSKGCTHCYAVNRVYRFSRNGGINKDRRFDGLVKEIKTAVVENGKKKEVRRKYFTGQILFNPGRLYEILKVKTSKRVFVNEFSDLLHPAVPMNVILEHFRVFRLATQHQFQILTKRDNRLRELNTAILREFGEWPPNVWQGVSVCSSAKIEMSRITALGSTQAKLKWISFEPWLSNDQPLLQETWPNLSDLMRENQIGWVVIGGESGSKKESRIMTEDDARYLFSAGRAAGCKVHFKQLGTRLAQEMEVYASAGNGEHRSKGGNLDQIPPDLAVREWPLSSEGRFAAVSNFNRRFNPKRWMHFRSGSATARGGRNVAEASR